MQDPEGKPTERQLEFLKELGATEKPRTKAEASELIDRVLESAPPAEWQLEYLRAMGHQEHITTRKQAHAIIRTIEGHATGVLYEKFPIFEYGDVVPKTVERKMVVALHESDCWKEVKEGKQISLERLRMVLGRAVGEAAFNLINKRSEDSVEAFEERYEYSAQYFHEFLEANGNKIDGDTFQEWLFQLWVAGIGSKMASCYRRWDQSFAQISAGRYQEPSKVNLAIMEHFRSRGLCRPRGGGCLSVVLLGVAVAVVVVILVSI